MNDRGWISVLLVDDEEVVRQRMRRLLEAYPGIRIIGETGDGCRGRRHVLGGQGDP